MSKKMDFFSQEVPEETKTNIMAKTTKSKMTSIKILLKQLKQSGIRIALGDNDKLKIRAPEGALTNKLKIALKESKQDIVYFLKEKQKNISADNLPLSFTQERLWFLDQLEDASNLYNMPGLFKLRGTIYIDKLEEAFRQIVQRHEVLRTHFMTKDGKGFAHIQSEGQWQLEQHDLSSVSTNESKSQSEMIIRQHLDSSFDLSKDCLLRTILIHLTDNESILLINMHHIISDGWSVQVLVREFINLYSALVENKKPELKELPIQYADYSLWQRDYLQGENLDKSLAYWRKQLSNVPVLELPTDFKRPAIQSIHGAMYHLSLDAKLFQKLKDIAQQEGVTLFMVLLAGLSLLLNRYSQQNDISIGSPIANRNRKELQDLIGFFANTLVFRQKVIPGQSISEFLQAIKQTTIDAYEFQETPFEKVVDGLNIERSLGHTPLFQVMLVLQNIAQERIELPELNIETMPFDTGSAKFDLTFTVEEAQSEQSGEPVDVSIEYNTDLFRVETIKRLSHHFTTVLEAIAQSTEQDVMSIDILSETERQQQLIQWQKQSVEHTEFLSVQQMFEAQVNQTPDAIALRFGQQSMSYKVLNAQANQLADYLKQQGIGRGQSVGICLNRSLEMIVALYGVLKSGAAYIPMDINYPKERLLYMLAETDAPLLITNNDLQETLNVEQDKVFLVDHQWAVLNDFSTENPEVIDQRNDPLYTIFTSGSTGQPKGARVRHSGELNLLPWYVNDFSMTEQDNVLLMSAFGFDLTQKNLFAPLVCGGTLVIPEIEHYDHQYLIDTIKTHDITWLNCAPSAFYPIVEQQKSWSKIASLRYVFLGGEPINLQKIAQWEAQCQCKLVNSYGPTECTDIAAYHVLDSVDNYDNKSFPIGQANHNVLLYILNEQQQLIPEGHVGELYIGGKGVGLGYINQPELTEEKFIKNPFVSLEEDKNNLIYRTGDLVRYQSDGVIEYIGRVDFQVKLRGLRIELGEIEYHLGQINGINDGVVRIVKDHNEVEQLVAYIVAESSVDKEQLRIELQDYLPEYMIPNHFIELDSIPLTPNGKVDNKALPELEIGSSEENYQAPESEEEVILCDVWSDILNLEKVGVNDNFFEMGGDSILSIQIISRANDKGLVLQARDIFEYQTVARLAHHAQTNAKNQRAEIKTELGVITGQGLLSPVQKRFFNQDFSEPNHWNQSILLSVSRTLEVSTLNKVLNILVQLHDVLHSHFEKNEQGEWIQFFDELNSELNLIETIDLSDAQNFAEALEQQAETYQASLNIGQGRLLQAVLFTSDNEAENRLLIIIHHLVIDGISWRVLFTEMQSICDAIINKKSFEPVDKKSSYRQWTQMLHEQANSTEFENELPFWQSLAQKDIKSLPVDTESDTITMSDNVFLHLELSKEQTQQLLLNTNSAYNTEINDILLSGLLLAIHNWCGYDHIALSLEGHGRETLSSSIDISNSVGWFTSIFPVYLEMAQSLENGINLSDLIKSVKEQLRQIPNQGVGYSILRYLRNDAYTDSQLAIEPQISFNYLGQSDNIFSNTEYFGVANEASGKKVSPDNHHPYLLDLNCIVVNGCLNLDWTFSGRHFSRETIDKLAQGYNDALIQIVEHCVASEHKGFTPSDFPLTQINKETCLTQSVLDNICELVTDNTTTLECIEDIYPLSPMQKGMLFHTAFDHSEEMYVEQLQLSFNGEIDIPVFEQSWKQLISQHTILRTQFVYQQGLEPLQIVKSMNSCDCHIEVVDCDGWDHQRIENYLKADRVRGFVLDSAPMMRWHLLKQADKILFVWTFHHLLADGWSTALLLQEALNNYKTLSTGKKIPASINDEYKTFIHHLLNQDRAAEQNFWTQYLGQDADISGATELPLTQARYDAERTAPVKKFKFDFSVEQTNALQSFSKQYHLTINTLVQGLWALLLGKYNRTDDVRYGVVVSGRPTDIHNVEHKVGLFINSLPLRIQIDKEKTTHQWFSELQQQQIEHQQYHHSAINDIQHWTQISASELFNHIFVFENYPVSDALNDDNLPFEVLDLEMVEKTNFPLTVSATLSEYLAIEFGYDSEVYSEQAIERLAMQLELLSHSIINAADTPIKTLEWLSQSDKKELLLSLNETYQDYQKFNCLHTIVEQQASLNSEKLAVQDYKGVQLSYGQLNQKANQLAHYLISKELPKESIIGVCMERTSDMLVSLLGILKAGHAYVPMDPEYPEERLSFILEDSETPVLLTQSHLITNLPEQQSGLLAIDESDKLEQYPVENPTGNAFTPEQLAYVIYTSGSTGKPKGVMVRHRNVQNLCQWHQDAFSVNDESRATQIANIAFDAAAWEIWPYLLSGASLYLVDQQTVLSGDALLSFYAEHKITHSFVPTPVAESLLQLSWQDNVSLQYLLTGGDRLSSFDADKYDFEFVNNYGPTETTVVATSITLTQSESLPPIGRPVSNAKLYIVDDDLNPVPMGVVGELLIGGEGVAKGYLNRPELTQEKFINDLFDDTSVHPLYRTGDLVRYRLDGNIEFVGRTDDQVKLRGYRIELGEITSTLSCIEGVKEAIVVVKSDQQGTKRLVAYWAGSDLEESELRKLLAKDLPDYMVPSAFVKMPALPLTAHGKIDTRALPDVIIQRSSAYQAAENEVERLFVQIWSDVLKKDSIGIHDNFFELGGDSILSIQIISRASEAGFMLQPRDVFEYQTIVELAQYAQQQVRDIETEQGVLEGRYALTPIQNWFFEQSFESISHWNQSVLLSVTKEFNESLLQQAFSALIQHHDVLNMVYELDDHNQWQQSYRSSESRNNFHVEVLEKSEQSDETIEKVANVYQAGLDIKSGELFKVVLFVTDDEQPNRLLIIAHHLVIDGVSWRILFADLQKACVQILNHQPVELGNKGSSFRQWQSALDVHAQTVSTDEVEYWQDVVEQAAADKLTVDRESEQVITRERHRISEKLSKLQTEQLLQQVNSAYNTEVNDILLSTMLLALNETMDMNSLSLMLEGHGREAISDNLDVSKTVGWFTNMYPVVLSMPSASEYANVIKSVKEQLRQIPAKGMGYSSLRYLHSDKNIRKSLEFKPEVSFNYLGQTGNLFEGNNYFGFANEPAGDSIAGDNKHPHLLDLSAIVIDGQLEISWIYSARHFNEISIDALSSVYLHILEQLIEHCLKPDNHSYTPSDFPLVSNLDQNKLDELVETLPEMVDVYPLSPLQEGMLFHSLYQQSEEVYIEQMRMTLTGELNIAHFEQAWNAVIQKHTILRTGFIAPQGLSPLQFVINDAHSQVLMTNAESWSEAELDDFLSKDRQQGFDLANPPLMRFNLLQQGSEQYIFVWTSHHILADGWSFPLIILEVMEHYESLEKGTSAKPLSVDEYKSFIHYLKQQDKQAEANYWQNYLSDVSGATALPFASHHYDSKNTGKNNFLSLDLTRAQTDALNDLTQQYHVTISTLIQGLWSLLLSQYSGDKEVLYGMTVSGRPSEISNIEQKVGLYINSLPVKMTINPEQPLNEWFEDLQQQQVEHQKFHHSGLSDIQQYTGIAADQLFNQLFVFENYPVSEALQDNQLSLNVDDVQLIEKTNYPLTITTHVKERLSIEFGFNTQVYPDFQVIENIAEHLGTLIDSVLAQPLAKVSELNWFSELEKHKVVNEWNQTQFDYNDQACLHELIEQYAEKIPNETAVVYKDHKLNYEQLNTQANQLAHYLIEQGIQTGDFVGLSAERSVELVVGLVAIIKAGAAYIPMDPEYPESRLKHMLDDSQAKIILTQTSIQDKLSDYQGQIFCLDTELVQLKDYSQSNPSLSASPEQAAYMIYTSGSTGLPKGVVCHHAGVINLLSHYNNILPFEEGEQHTLWTSISFDVSVHEFFSALITGGAIHLVPESIRLDADSVFQYMHDNAITSSYLPPFFLTPYQQWVINNPGKSVLKRMLVGVEPIAESLLIDIQNSVPGLQIINGYGPTEATICCSLYPINSNNPSSLINTPIGKPVGNCQIYLLDEQANPVPVGVKGELTIGGRGITHGYWNKPELTAEKFIDNPYGEGKLYRTGDMARYLPDGNIEFIGRTDDQVKLRGYRIELGEIESQLRTMPMVKEAVAIIYQKGSLAENDVNKRLIAYVTVESVNDFDAQQTKERLNTNLPDYMIPAAIIAMEKFPLSPNGKIDKKSLPEPEIEQTKYIAADTDIQKQLVTIWCDVLSMDTIGIKDNFFELGGHSLLATQVITHINKFYEVDLPIKALFDYPTVEQLAMAVQKTETEELSNIKQAAIMPSVQQKKIPLSFAQERLWFIEQFDHSGSGAGQQKNAYKIPALVKLNGDLNVHKVQAAFATIISRHQVLSTRFVTKAGEAWQEVVKPSDWQLQYDDYSPLESDEQIQEKLTQRVTVELNRPFDISQGDLFRTVLLKISEQEHMLLLVMHHIISDGWSMSVLINEFISLYTGINVHAQKQDNPVQLLPRLTVQYTDFSVWQRKWLSGERLDNQLNYWTNKLQDVAVLELPTDYQRPSVQSFKGEQYDFMISSSIQNKLNRLSSDNGSTLFMTLMSAFGVLLNKYTNQQDLCIGSPIANRNHKEIESLIGFFVNTLALRQEINPAESFTQLLQQVKQTTLDAYEYQDVPFEKVVDNLNLERSMSHSPVFQVMFILQNTPSSMAEIDGLQIEEHKLETHTAKFDLTFTCTETAEGLMTNIEYRSELFKPETIKRLAMHFRNILEVVSDNADTAIADINYLSPQEKQQQLVQWQEPAVDHPLYQSIADMFEHQVIKTPSNIALRYGEQSLSYQQFNEQANQFAHYLTQHGIGKGQSVGICLKRSLEMMISLYAVIKTGASYIPMDINYPKERLLYMLDATESPLIITQSDIQEKLSIAEDRSFLVDQQWSSIKNYSVDNLPVQDLVEEPLYTIFTSGSTGLPKGARVKHHGELNLLPWYINDFNMNEADNLLLMSAFGFDLTQKNLFAPLMCGATLVIPDIDHYDNDYYVQLIQKEQISWLNCAPSAFYPLVENQRAWGAVQTLRYVFLGGEPISLHKVQSWNEQSNCKIVNSYGPTECTDIAAYHVLENLIDYQQKAIPIGKANHNVKLYILNDDLQLIPEGNVGELYIGGEGIGLGYINQAELTAEKFIASPFSDNSELIYRTGDLVRYQGDGVIEYIGRVDFQVKLRGLRIELGEIEYQLAQHDDITDVAVRIVTDNNDVEQLVAYYVAVEGHGVDKAQVRNNLSEHLPDYMLPNFMIELDALPLTPNGKVDNKALPAIEAVVQNDNYQAPETQTQQKLADVWSDILGINPIGCQDNFFNLGGNSLVAVRVLAKINELFATDLTVKSLFEQPVLERFAKLIDEQVHMVQESIVVNSRPEVLPLSFAQNRLWFIEQMNPTDAAYNISSALKIKGKVDHVVMQNAFRHLIHRHESLRTSFDTEQGEAVQIIKRSNQGVFKDWTLPLIDLSHQDNANDEVIQRAECDARKPFVLNGEPLFRIQLLKLSDNEFVLLFAMHHIISDGWSMEVLQRDFVKAYELYYRNEEHLISQQLPKLSIQYADFAIWQQDRMDEEYIEGQLDFWKTYLKGIPEQLRLPTDYPRPIVATQNGAHYSFKIDQAVLNKLQSQAKEQQVSMFMQTLAAYQILLSKYSEQKDICVGVPVSGRERAEVKDLIGFFVNVIVVRSDLGLNPTLTQLLKQVKQNALDAFEHQAIPAEMVIDAVQPERNTSHAPIAQVGFSYTDDNGRDFNKALSGLSFEPIAVETNSAKYDITLALSETDNGLFGEIEFNTDLFNESTIAGMAEHFSYLLEVICEQPEQPVESISLLKNEELFELLECDHKEFESIQPLSSTQHDIYLQSLLNEGGLQNCMGYLTAANGDFDPEVWHEALGLLYQFEPYLRTEFRPTTASLTDIAYQCIHRQRTPHFEFIDLSPGTEHYGKITAEEWIKKETYKSYTLSHTDLISNFVFKVDEQKHFVGAAFHHIMLDGVGGYMMWKKLTILYNALMDGSIEDGSYVHAQPLFSQYVHEHNREMDHQDVLAFWKERAQTIEPLAYTLPSYETQGSSEQHQVSSTNPEAKVIQRTLELNNEEWVKIRQFCRKQRTTPALYFKAIYGILLSSYCRAEKPFAIGDYISSRKKQHMYSLGCYFEQTPFVFDTEAMSGELSEYLNAIKVHQKEVNKNIPISLAQQNSIFSTSVFRPTYNFYSWPYADEFIGHMQKGDTYAPEVAETQLQFIVKAMENNAKLILDYTSNTFAEEHFLQQVKAISDQFIAGHTDLNHLQWINKEEQRQQLVDWQSDSIELKHTAVHEMFEQQVLKTPDNVAVRWAGQSISFKTLNDKANQLAHYMQEKGIARGDQIGICLGRSFDMIIAVLATLKTGAGYVPMDITYPEERLKFTLSEINAGMLITDSAMNDKLAFESDKTFILDPKLADTTWSELSHYSSDNLNAESDQHDPFYTIFTSGSTGRPKGAAVSHRCEINMLDWYTTTSYQMHEDEKVLVMSAFGFDLTQKNIFAPLTTGATLVLPEFNEYDPRRLTRLIEQEKVTWTTCTPSAFFPLVEDESYWSELESLNYVFFGGEPLKADKMKAWKQQSQCNLVNTFAPTECTDIAAFHHLDHDLNTYDHRAIPIGKPNANVQIYILDKDLNLLPPGMTGEICIGGDSVGLGYITQPELTREKFLPDPFSNNPNARIYKTGDLGRYQDSEGNIEHAGRVDFQLKLRGLRIELGEIEYSLQQQQGVKEVLVMEFKGQLVAYLTSEKDIDETQVKHNLSRFLPQYMIPQQMIVLDKFPLTEHGKIDRKALPEPSFESVTAYHAPETATHKILVDIWSKVLDVSQLGIDDNFFDLGGHSLIAVKLIAQIEERFNCKLPIVQLLQTPTIADIAEYIEQGNDSESQLVTLQSEGELTPVFCIHGVGGNIHTFSQLAEQMGNNRPFYAIQSAGLLENSEIQSSIQAMVTSYIDEIEKVSSEGPVIMAGHSMGGVIAFEIASYLKQQGREVEQLILMDSPSPKIIKEELSNKGFEWLDETTRQQLQGYMELSFDENFEQLSFNEKLDYMLEQSQQAIKEDDNLINRTIAVHIANFMAINRFDTDSLYDGDMLLLKAESNEGHSRYWEYFTSGKLITVDVNGDHHTMLDAPHVGYVADVISNKV